MKILFAEDDLISFQILESYLRKWKYDAIGVKNGMDAWEILERDDCPKVAILDWMMPKMDGLEICRKVSAGNFNHMIHMILVTARSDNESIVKGLEAGASDYISKPYDPKILKARIDAGARIIEMNQDLMRYLRQMEELANNRAKQLIHSDRLATIGMLSSGIAHEINNPTTFISVNVQTLDEMWPVIDKVIKTAPESEDKEIAMNISEEMDNIFKNMKKGVTRIKSIVDSLKHYYKSDKGTIKKMDNLSEVIYESINFCHNRLKTDINTIVNIEDDLPEIYMNSQEIEQVLVNLLLNAADSMKDSTTKELSISTTNKNNFVQISIKDTGCGISDENVDLIFQPFFTTKGKEEGTGMGLSIAKNIIDNHRGELLVNPVQTGGTEFIIKLPNKYKENHNVL